MKKVQDANQKVLKKLTNLTCEDLEVSPLSMEGTNLYEFTLFHGDEQLGIIQYEASDCVNALEKFVEDVESIK